MSNPTGEALGTIGKAISIIELLQTVTALSTAAQAALQAGQTHVTPEAMDEAFARNDEALRGLREAIARREREEQQP